MYQVDAFVTACLVLNGASAYGFTVLAARALGPAAYGTLAALAALVFVLGAGLLLPVEQALTTARGRTTTPIFVGAAIALVLIAASWTAGKQALDSLFDGNNGLTIAFSVAVVSYLAQLVCRGLCARSGRFNLYGRSVALDGIIRSI